MNLVALFTFYSSGLDFSTFGPDDRSELRFEFCRRKDYFETPVEMSTVAPLLPRGDNPRKQSRTRQLAWRRLRNRTHVTEVTEVSPAYPMTDGKPLLLQVAGMLPYKGSNGRLVFAIRLTWKHLAWPPQSTYLALTKFYMALPTLAAMTAVCQPWHKRELQNLCH